jgi:AcrR family transcriptional regulator
MKTSRREKREKQRAAILDCARHMFAQRNFEDVTMEDIAKRAKVARATVFNHFASKHALIEAITAEVIAYWMDVLERALKDEVTSTTVMLAQLFVHMSGVEQYYRFHRGVFREIALVQTGLSDAPEVARLQARARALLAEIIERGQRRGETRDDLSASELAGAFLNLANGTITEWLFEDPTGSLEARMERAATVYLEGASLRKAPRQKAKVAGLDAVARPSVGARPARRST